MNNTNVIHRWMCNDKGVQRRVLRHSPSLAGWGQKFTICFSTLTSSQWPFPNKKNPQASWSSRLSKWITGHSMPTSKRRCVPSPQRQIHSVHNFLHKENILFNVATIPKGSEVKASIMFTHMITEIIRFITISRDSWPYKTLLTFVAWFLLWNTAVRPYIDRCVSFQITCNQFNLPQVDSNQGVKTCVIHFKCNSKGYKYLCKCDISVFPFY